VPPAPSMSIDPTNLYAGIGADPSAGLDAGASMDFGGFGDG
jgi:hypothetical protein